MRPWFRQTLSDVLGNDAFQDFLSILIAGYARFVYRTTRWQEIGLEHLAGERAKERPVFACFWHGRIGMMPFIWRDPAPFHTLCSRSRDGKISAKTQRRLGIEIIFGSTKQPIAATRTIVKALRQGKCVAVTPDGPRGPRMRAKPGMIAMARASDLPIVPLSFAVRRRIVLKSWDRQIVPLPFNRGVLIAGPPLDVADGSIELQRQRLEDALSALTREADARCGVSTPEAAPAPILDAHATA